MRRVQSSPIFTGLPPAQQLAAVPHTQCWNRFAAPLEHKADKVSAVLLRPPTKAERLEAMQHPMVRKTSDLMLCGAEKFCRRARRAW